MPSNPHPTATGKTISETDIRYVGRDDTAYAESATAPTDAGKYTAKITIEGKTASMDCEIAGEKGSEVEPDPDDPDHPAIDSLPQTGDAERSLFYGLAVLVALTGIGLLIKKK